MARFRIRTRNGEYSAVLDDSDISNAVLLSLPFKAELNMLGGSIYFEMPLRSIDESGERRKTFDEGDVVWWPGVGAIVILFGQTPLSGEDGRPVVRYPCIKIGRLEGDFSSLEDAGDRQRIELLPADRAGEVPEHAYPRIGRMLASVRGTSLCGSVPERGKYAPGHPASMFIGRERELAMLEGEYSKCGFGLFVLYGRRRIGKTSLLKRFVEGKRNAVYFQAIKGKRKTNMDAMAAAMPAEAVLPSDRNVEGMMGAVARLEGPRPVLVLDEFPYLARSGPDVMGLVTDFVDRCIDEGTDLLLILCGSSMGFMKDGVLGERSPLFGRRTGQLKMGPLDYLESAMFLEGFSNREKMSVYGIAGGVPMYLRLFDPKKDLRANLRDVFLAPNSLMSKEAEFLLLEEMKDPSTYGGILSAIAGGRTRPSQIADAVGDTSSVVARRLADLEYLGIVSKDAPMLSDARGRASYAVADPFFRFYYRMMYPYGEPGSDSERERLLDRIMAMLPDYDGRSFETICRQFVRFRLGYRKVGYWRGSDPETRVGEEVDVVAVDTYSDDRPVLIAECKCQKKKVGWAVYNDLVRKGRLIRAERKEYALFSCSGFEDGLLDGVPEGCSLYALDDLFADGPGERPPYLI